jgi:small GTP-binding protein
MEEEEKEIKLITLGNSEVGKSSIINQFVFKNFDKDLINTIGMDSKNYEIKIDDKTIKLKIWDTAGQERFRSIQKHYYNKVDGILFIYDITNKTSFDIIEQWYNEVKNYNDNIIGVLIGNKTDLEDNRTVTTEQGKELAIKLNFAFYECNSVDGENVDEAFESLVKMILEEKNKNKNKETDTALKIEDKIFSEQRQNESSKKGGENSGCIC